MLTKTIYISLVGLGVVFTFLSIIFFLLKGLKFFAVKEDAKVKKESLHKVSSNNSKKIAGDNVEEEVMVAILAALNEYETIDEERIVICKK